MHEISVLCSLFLAGVLVYVIAGYPLLLAWLAARYGKPVIRGGEPRTVSFVIAVHNGEAFLEAKLESILDLDYPPELMQIIVVSDGSTNRTTEIASSFADRGVLLLTVARGGKPQALNAAIPRATGEIVVLPTCARCSSGKRCSPVWWNALKTRNRRQSAAIS